MRVALTGHRHKRLGYKQLDIKWVILSCPKTWPINLIYVNGENQEEPYVEKNNSVVKPLVKLSKTIVITQITTNISVIGALIYILNFFIYLLLHKH